MRQLALLMLWVQVPALQTSAVQEMPSLVQAVPSARYAMIRPLSELLVAVA